jgi:hypothetical protein
MNHRPHFNPLPEGEADGEDAGEGNSSLKHT